jgi:hypothetical protein
MELNSFTLNKISEKKVGGGFQKRTFINVQNRKVAREFSRREYNLGVWLENALNTEKIAQNVAA